MHLDWTTILGTIIATWPPVIAGFILNSRRTRSQLTRVTAQQSEQIAELTRQQTEQIAGIADQQTEQIAGMTSQQTATLLAGTDPVPDGQP